MEMLSSIVNHSIKIKNTITCEKKIVISTKLSVKFL